MIAGAQRANGEARAGAFSYFIKPQAAEATVAFCDSAHVRKLPSPAELAELLHHHDPHGGRACLHSRKYVVAAHGRFASGRASCGADLSIDVEFAHARSHRPLEHLHGQPGRAMEHQRQRRCFPDPVQPRKVELRGLGVLGVVLCGSQKNGRRRGNPKH